MSVINGFCWSIVPGPQITTGIGRTMGDLQMIHPSYMQRRWATTTCVTSTKSSILSDTRYPFWEQFLRTIWWKEVRRDCIGLSWKTDRSLSHLAASSGDNKHEWVPIIHTDGWTRGLRWVYFVIPFLCAVDAAGQVVVWLISLKQIYISCCFFHTSRKVAVFFMARSMVTSDFWICNL